MNKRMFFFLSSIVLTAIVLGFSNPASAYPSGAPAGYTGSPGDGQHCQSCHGGSNATVNGWITTNIPTDGYTPGTVYNITATVSGTGKKGFEVSPQNASGTQLGTLAAGTNNHLVGGTKYVTQNSSGSSSSTVVYNFTWTAPVTGTGTVTFYGAFTVGKTNTKLSTLIVNENAAVPLAAAASATPGNLCAGQPVQLNVIPSGGSGTYTYNWSSVPPGFTSSIQNPVATPTGSTQYIAHVSDGTTTVDAPADVTVTAPATAFAGNDTTCLPTVASFALAGTATNYSSVAWETSGTGTFTSLSSLSGSYIPSAADVANGQVELTLIVQPMTPCTNPSTDSRMVYFSFPAGTYEDTGGSLTVYPNPSDGKFRIIPLNDAALPLKLVVKNLKGVVLISSDISDVSTRFSEIDLGGHPAGIYFLTVEYGEFVVNKKLVLR